MNRTAATFRIPWTRCVASCGQCKERDRRSIAKVSRDRTSDKGSSARPTSEPGPNRKKQRRTPDEQGDAPTTMTTSVAAAVAAVAAATTTMVTAEAVAAVDAAAAVEHAAVDVAPVVAVATDD